VGLLKVLCKLDINGFRLGAIPIVPSHIFHRLCIRSDHYRDQCHGAGYHRGCTGRRQPLEGLPDRGILPCCLADENAAPLKLAGSAAGAGFLQFRVGIEPERRQCCCRRGTNGRDPTGRSTIQTPVFGSGSTFCFTFEQERLTVISAQPLDVPMTRTVLRDGIDAVSNA